MNNSTSITPAPLASDQLAKRIFVFAVVGVCAYVAAVIVLMSFGG